MKNDFAIKFNSLEEYREIEKFLKKRVIQIIVSGIKRNFQNTKRAMFV